MNLRSALVVAVVSGIAMGASAQTMKPGLWEISQKMQGGSGDLSAQMAAAQEQMAKLPPERSEERRVGKECA